VLCARCIGDCAPGHRALRADQRDGLVDGSAGNPERYRGATREHQCRDEAAVERPVDTRRGVEGDSQLRRHENTVRGHVIAACRAHPGDIPRVADVDLIGPYREEPDFRRHPDQDHPVGTVDAADDFPLSR